MALHEADIARIARLARIELNADQSTRALHELNGLLGIIEQLQAVDTSNVQPLAHPLAAYQTIELRLRDDIAAPANTTEQRAEILANAPDAQNGVFLVPKVID